jgi:hypothetical protein
MAVGHVVAEVRYGAKRRAVCSCGTVIGGRTDEAMSTAFASHRLHAIAEPKERRPVTVESTFTGGNSEATRVAKESPPIDEDGVLRSVDASPAAPDDGMDVVEVVRSRGLIGAGVG